MGDGGQVLRELSPSRLLLDRIQVLDPVQRIRQAGKGGSRVAVTGAGRQDHMTVNIRKYKGRSSLNAL